jgi:hypothetical protein
MIYRTLDELKKLTPIELMAMWRVGSFPFDAATCKNCVSTHGHLGCEQHPEFAQTAHKMDVYLPNEKLFSPKNLETLYSLRKRFRDAYPWNPAEWEEEVKPAEVESVPRASKAFQGRVSDDRIY